MIVLVAIVAALCAGMPSFAGRVVSVHDGDTITVLDAEHVRHKIRLAGIDAPEIGQPWGARAKQGLSSRAFQQEVMVEPRGRDRYGRTVADVRIGSRWINREMVEAGLAWQYVRFNRSTQLRDAQFDAFEAERGLWSDREPTPPWEWRRSKK